MEENNKPDINNISLTRLEKISLYLEKMNFGAYVDLIGNPWRMLLNNFLGGLARGFGIAVGMTIIVAIIGFIITSVLSQLVSLPLIGKFIASIIEMVQEYLKTPKNS